MAWLRLMTVGLFLSVALAGCGDDDFTVPDGGTATPRDLSVVLGDAGDGGDLSVTDANADANADANNDLTGVDLLTPDLTGVDLTM